MKPLNQQVQFDIFHMLEKSKKLKCLQEPNSYFKSERLTSWRYNLSTDN